VNGAGRPPAVAGSFYPADPAALGALVDAQLAAVSTVDDRTHSDGRCYIVPHAGLVYSGPTAAHAYARLAGASPARIVLIGPAHFVPLRGCAVPAAAAWQTPLGPVEVDTAGCTELVGAGLAVMDDAPHQPEHSLEVQLPFLQRILPPTRILPVAVGQSSVEDIAGLIDAVWRADGVLLCSTDLSHYQDEATAQRQDAATVDAILRGAVEDLGVPDACGIFALRGLVSWAARRRAAPRLLHLTTSASTGGSPNRVVGYCAIEVA
jgi:MEMO1 family protein